MPIPSKKTSHRRPRSNHALPPRRLSHPPDRRAGAARRHQRPELLRSLLLQPARLQRRTLPDPRHGAVPEPRRPGRLRSGCTRRDPPGGARLSRAGRGPHGSLDGTLPHRGSRGIAPPAPGARAQRARRGDGSDLAGGDPGAARAAPPHASIRAAHDRHPADLADRPLDRDARDRRGDLRDHPRSLVGKPRPLVGYSSDRRARAPRSSRWPP